MKNNRNTTSTHDTGQAWLSTAQTFRIVFKSLAFLWPDTMNSLQSDTRYWRWIPFIGYLFDFPGIRSILSTVVVFSQPEKELYFCLDYFCLDYSYFGKGASGTYSVIILENAVNLSNGSEEIIPPNKTMAKSSFEGDYVQTEHHSVILESQEGRYRSTLKILGIYPTIWWTMF